MSQVLIRRSKIARQLSTAEKERYFKKVREEMVDRIGQGIVEETALGQ
jgi:hypothetical protein